jgi:hypothetical protein
MVREHLAKWADFLYLAVMLDVFRRPQEGGLADDGALAPASEKRRTMLEGGYPSDGRRSRVIDCGHRSKSRPSANGRLIKDDAGAVILNGDNTRTVDVRLDCSLSKGGLSAASLRPRNWSGGAPVSLPMHRLWMRRTRAEPAVWSRDAPLYERWPGP